MSYYLQHHGILGMKWGVRRYQNADGSLTEAGKVRMKKKRKKVNDYLNETTHYTDKKGKSHIYTRSEKQYDALRYGRRTTARIAASLENGRYQSLDDARRSAERGRRIANVMAAALAYDHYFGNDVVMKTATAAKNTIKKTVSQKMAEKAARDAMVKLSARKLRKVAGDVYEWV